MLVIFVFFFSPVVSTLSGEFEVPCLRTTFFAGLLTDVAVGLDADVAWSFPGVRDVVEAVLADVLLALVVGVLVGVGVLVLALNSLAQALAAKVIVEACWVQVSCTDCSPVRMWKSLSLAGNSGGDPKINPDSDPVG